jgi:hypothetical protein
LGDAMGLLGQEKFDKMVAFLHSPVGLVGAAETALGDLVLEPPDLVGGELAGVALVKEGAEGVEPLVAEDTEPFAQLGKADAQQLGDLFTGFARGDSQVAVHGVLGVNVGTSSGVIRSAVGKGGSRRVRGPGPRGPWPWGRLAPGLPLLGRRPSLACCSLAPQPLPLSTSRSA